MAKLIKLIVTNCNECPYHEYDPNYGMSYNSGYDCNLTGNRIADDIGSKEPDLEKLPIPDWCTLNNIDEVAYNRKKKINKLLKK